MGTHHWLIMEDTTYVNSYSAAQRDVHKTGTRLLDDFSICLNGGCMVFCALLLRMLL